MEEMVKRKNPKRASLRNKKSDNYGQFEINLNLKPSDSV